MIRWGIIGCGDVCEIKSGPGFQKAAGSALVAVMRRDGAKAADFAKRHGVPRWYDDADALIADKEVDAVYVATPAGSHCDYALRIAAAGKPAYIEKPMARSAEECLRMCEAFEAKNLPLFVGFYRRGLPRFVKAKQLVDSGSIGRVTGVRYRLTAPRHLNLDAEKLEWRLKCEDSGGGLLLDLGSHTLDAIDFIVGPIAQISGQAANLASVYDVEDHVVMQMRFENGALGSASWNFATTTREDLIEIEGSTGVIRLSTFDTEPVELHTIDPSTRKGVVEHFPQPTPPHVHQPLIQSIVDELSGTGQCPSTGRTALRTAVVMDRALENYYGSRRAEFWKTPEKWPGRRK